MGNYFAFRSVSGAFEPFAFAGESITAESIGSIVSGRSSKVSPGRHHTYRILFPPSIF